MLILSKADGFGGPFAKGKNIIHCLKFNNLVL